MEFDQTLRLMVHKHLSAHQVRSSSAEKRAAVALIMTHAGHGADLPDLPHYEQWSQDAALLLTRRSKKLKRHAGQWALPGGRLDAHETPFEAAIRETQEEIGLTLSDTNLLGLLDDYVTRSGYVVTPLVFWAGAVRNPNLNPDEVASIHRIPLTELLREDAPMLDYDELADEPGSDNQNPVLRMPIGNAWIAAPTAALMYQFREVCLRGLQTRVAHFEQPRFAWK